MNPVWLIGLLQKQPQHYRLDGPTRLKFFQELDERKTRMDWVRQFMRQLEENATVDKKRCGCQNRISLPVTVSKLYKHFAIHPISQHSPAP